MQQADEGAVVAVVVQGSAICVVISLDLVPQRQPDVCNAWIPNGVQAQGLVQRFDLRC